MHFQDQAAGEPIGFRQGRPLFINSRGQVLIEACVWILLIVSVVILLCVGYGAEYVRYRSKLKELSDSLSFQSRSV